MEPRVSEEDGQFFTVPKSIFDRMTDGLFALDGQWRFTYVNPAASQLLFRERVDLVGKVVWDEFPEAVHLSFYTHYQTAMRQQVVVAFDEYYPPLDKWFDIQAYPSPDGLTVLFRDITRKRRERMETEEYFRSLFENHPDSVCSLSLDGRILNANQSVKQLTGYAVDELIGRTFAQLMPRGQSISDVTHFSLVMSGQPQNFTTQLMRKDRQRIVVDVTLLPIIVEGGIVGVYCIGRDITEQKKVEMRLINAERISHSASWERDIKSGKIYWSDELYRIVGLNPGEDIHIQRLFQCVHPDDRERVHAAFCDAEAGHPYDIEYRVVRPDGAVRTVYSRGELIYEQGEVTSICGFMHDITERKLTEETLRQSQDNLRMAQQMAQLGHYDWDIARNRLVWSEEMLPIWGIRRAEWAETIEAYYETVHPEDLDIVQHAINHALRGESLDLEYRICRQDGEQRIIHALGKTIFDETGRPVRFFGTVQDITQQRHTEEMLRKSEKLSVAGQLAAGIAHEIRNPLTALKGFTNLLRDATPAEKERYFNIMQSEFNRIELILGELLILAKPQAMVFKPREIESILLEITDLLNPQAILNSVVIRHKFEADSSLVNCEENQLKQVFVNVMKNAMEAMPSGGQLLVQLTSDDSSVHIHFVDEGGGIPQEKLPKLGEPFYTTKEKGTGLGLMVSHKIIHAHQGTLGITSEVGRGTTVQVTLPLLAQ